MKRPVIPGEWGKSVIVPFPSGIDPSESITGTAGSVTFSAATQITPSWPSTHVLIKAVAAIKFAEAYNSDVGVNAIDLAGVHDPALQVSLVTDGVWTDALLLPDNMLAIPGSSYRGGDEWRGNVDIKAQIANGQPTQFRLGDDIKADNNNIELHDIQFTLFLWFEKPEDT